MESQEGENVKKVLFIAPAYFGTGETVNAVIVAQQLRKRHIECIFIVSAYGENFVKNNNFDYFIFTDDKRKNIEFTKEIIKKENPDVVVVADYYLFYLSKELPKFLWIGFLEDLGVTTITFDSIGLGREFPSRNYILTPELFPPRTHNILYRVPSFVETIICPSPPFNNVKNLKDVQCGRLYSDDFTTVHHDKDNMRKELGVKDNLKLIFHPIPKWSLSTFGVSSPVYYPVLTDIVMFHLSQVDCDTHLVCVNPSHHTLYREGGRIQVQNYEFLPFDLFMKYLFSSDLVITDNLLSATIGKAILNRVPVLLLGNTYYIEDAFSLERIGTMGEDVLSLVKAHVKRSQRFPVTPFWGAFKDDYAARDIQKTLIQEELFNSKGIQEKMKDILTDSCTQEALRRNQDEYVREIQSLPTMADIVLSFT